jgi:serine/threonine protein kinase
LNPAPDPPSGSRADPPGATPDTLPRTGKSEVSSQPPHVPEPQAGAAAAREPGNDAPRTRFDGPTLPLESPTLQRGARTRPAAHVEPVLGQTLKGRYRLEQRIGSGGMGIVFRATDLEAIRLGHSSSTVAIKVLTAELRSHEASLFDEVQKTRQLQQENIVNVYGFEPDETGSFMVMELLSGLPLDRFVTGSWVEGIPLPVALRYIEGMGAALSYAHQRGVIHSDFKPSNVFIVADSAKVLDFGIARAARAGDITHPAGETLLGVTPEFASCEMLEDLPADKRDDVFCFGLVVYFLLTGKHPFNNFPATDARELALSVPPVRGLTRQQNAALRRALSFERSRRSSSIEELLQALQGGRSSIGMRIALGSATLITVAALGYLYHDATVGSPTLRPQDSDRQFVLGLCNHTARPRSSPADAQLIATLLEQGNNYLRIGQNPFDPGILSENVSSAVGAFQDALSLAPQDCDAAAEGILKVVTAYKNEATRLYRQGDYRKSAELATIALRYWKDSSEMRELLEKTSRYLPPDTDGQP